MKRIFIIVMLTLIFSSAWQALMLKSPDWLNLLCLPPIVLVFSLQYFRPLETIYVGLFCGLVTDVLGGFMIGSNMVMMLCIAFVLSALNVFSGRILKREMVFYAMTISFGYRFLLLLAQGAFLGSKANIYLAQLILGPVVDGLASRIFYFALINSLTLAKAFDQSDTYKNRIGF